MSRFIKYLHEEHIPKDYNIYELNEGIHKNCKYYLQLTKGKYIHTRGMQVSDIAGTKSVRQDRRSKGMDDYTAGLFNDWLKENGHVPRYKSLIASSIKWPSTIFGLNYYIFPWGKFNYTWARTKDINMHDGKTGWYDTAIENFFETKFFDVDYKSTLLKPFHKYFTTNKGITEAYKNEYEIWFDCKVYYYARRLDFFWDEKDQKFKE